jgi:hypothetical protein
VVQDVQEGLLAAGWAEEVGVGRSMTLTARLARAPPRRVTVMPLQLLTRDHGWGYPSHRPAPSIVCPTHPT